MEVTRVLLVEADPAVWALTEAFLAGQQDIELCGTAWDGHGALEQIRSRRPDVVLMELVLPGLDGLGVLRALREEPPGLMPAVIVTSCFMDRNVVSYALSLGARYYLLKPLQYSELPCTIRGLREDALERRARQLLLRMGVPARSKGLTAAASAAAALAADSSGTMLLKEAYFSAIQAGHTDYACVEKNIRYMVGRIHAAGGEDYRCMMGGMREEKPDNDSFLRRLAKKLREG